MVSSSSQSIGLDQFDATVVMYSNESHAHVHQNYVQKNVQGSISHNSSRIQTTKMLINSRMDKHMVVHSHNCISNDKLYLHAFLNILLRKRARRKKNMARNLLI